VAIGARRNHYGLCVEDGVKDLAQGMYSGTSVGFRGRDMGLYGGPLGIGEVRRIRLSHKC